MINLFTLGYVLGVMIIVSAIWLYLLPPDMVFALKVRFVGFVTLILVIIYFVIKNIFLTKDR